MHGSHDHAVGFEVPQLLRQHLLGDLRNRALQIREAQHLAAEEVKQDQQFPAAVDELQRLLDAFRRRERRVLGAVTFR